MDFMQPRLTWIDGICYRTLHGNVNVQHGDNYGDVADEYDDEVCCLEEAEDAFDVDCVDDGRFRLFLPIADAFFGIIIGKKGATKKRIESETRAKVVIPRQPEKESLRIDGENRNSVVSAANRVLNLVQVARERQEFTHFLSVPMNKQTIVEAFETFRDDVLGLEDKGRGVDRSIFQDSSRLHLTIGVMALMDDREREKATALLYEAKSDLVKAPFEIAVEGLEIMNDDAEETKVLYVKVKSDTLQRIADGLVDKFVASGLMFRRYEHVKLHMTAMNSKFCVETATFDARNILSAFADRKFGTSTVDEIHLSQRRLKNLPPGQYYKSTATIKL